MLRVAIQVKELISSNVTSAVEAASDPLKMLNKLQREIEESIIALQGERTRTSQRKSRLEAEQTQTGLREADWGDKAKTAMVHDREDLARQALIAREECSEVLEELAADIKVADDELAEIDQAIADLEAKREDTRKQARDHAAMAVAGKAGGPGGASSSKADRHMNRISELEKRTEFATDASAERRAKTSVDEEIEAMRRDSKIDAELAAMKSTATKPASAKAPAKKRATKKA